LLRDIVHPHAPNKQTVILKRAQAKKEEGIANIKTGRIKKIVDKLLLLF